MTANSLPTCARQDADDHGRGSRRGYVFRYPADAFPGRRGGFTLIEVMVATMVMAMMMISLLSYVQYGAAVWKRGEQVMTLSNSYRGISDLLARELSYSWKLGRPTATEGALPFVEYDATIASGSTSGTATFRIEWASATGLLRKRITSSSSVLSGVLVADTAAETSSTKIARTRYEFTIARDVATFAVTRLSTVSLAVQVGVQSLDMGAVASEAITMCATNTFLAPGVQ